MLYYGPSSEAEVVKLISEQHTVAPELKPLEMAYPAYLATPESKVYMVQYDAKQIYYLQYSNRGEKFDVASDPYITMYNEYFGGGMNAIVFQEMREARGLAYSSQARLMMPSHKDDTYMYSAIEAFDEIINDMPESQAAFDVAKEALVSRLRTDRVTGEGVISKYLSDRELGVTEPREKQLYEKVQTLTLEDVTLYSSENLNNVTCSTADLDFAVNGTYSAMSVVDLKGRLVVGGGKWGTLAEGSIKPYRLHMTLTPKATAYNTISEKAMKSITMSTVGEELEDGTTVIYDVQMENNAPEGIYDLQGRRVVEPKKGGLYIVNGKKVIF